VTAGEIVVVDWRDALPRTGEPNKLRPAVIVGATRLYGSGLPFKVVVPLTSEPALAIVGASLRIEPRSANGCTEICYALSWNVQTVPRARLTATSSKITDDQLAEIRRQVASCVDAA
jgi:mRNA-degrading endonuclease toxin of MazEF toxin-antitoxin module